jgi:hypothetical protein
MATMGCKQFLDQLDSWMEGERQPGARAHVAGCSRCRALAQDFDAITSVARSMNEEAEPPAYLWNSIRTQLVQEGVIRETPAAKALLPGTFWRHWFPLPTPALAGISLLVLLAASVSLRGPLTRRVNDYRWIQGTQSSTTSLNAQLDSVEHTTLASLDSNQAMAAALHRNLAIVDNYIALCEKSVRENPQSEMARDFLYGAYQQKASLLAQMNEQGE